MTPAQIEAYVDAAAAVLHVPVAAEHRAGVLNYFALAAEMAASVEAHPFTVSDDPAVAFIPIEPVRRSL